MNNVVLTEKEREMLLQLIKDAEILSGDRIERNPEWVALYCKLGGDPRK